jgi:hypothetical protein
MCGFVAHILDIKTMSSKKKKELEKFLKRRKKELEAAVKELDDAIEIVEKG